MVIAIVTAGGIGSRMGQDIPKQFINVYDKPIVIYTLEAFQRHPEIDAIVVPCLEGWHDVLRAYCKQFGISKLESIVSGGKNGQDSIRNALQDIAKRHGPEDIVIVHDGNRPLVSEEIISDNIRVCRESGNASAAYPCTSAMLITSDSISATSQISRDTLKVTQTPNAFFLGELLQAHKEALEKGITNSVASCTMYIELGRTVYFSKGSSKNIRLTTAEDIEIFKALLMAKKDAWLH